MDCPSLAEILDLMEILGGLAEERVGW